MKYSVKLTDPWYRVHESIHSTEIVAASVPEARSAASRWAKTVGIGYVVSDGRWDCHAPLFGDQEFRDNPDNHTHFREYLRPPGRNENRAMPWIDMRSVDGRFNL